MKAPMLTIILPTYNAKHDLVRFFDSFTKQKIAKDQIELLVIDGGSTDGTLELAKKNGATIIHNPHKLTEPAVALGFQNARGELVMVLAADNLFPDPEALVKIISVFRDKKIIAAFPKHETGPGDNLYSRYVNTFTDPYTHFVYQDAANARTFHRLYKTITHNELYDIFDYTTSKMRPIIALAQGFTIRKKFAPVRSEISDDVLSVYCMIEAGNQIAYVHGVSLWHYTIRDTAQFISKTKRAVENALLRRDSGITKRNRYLTTVQKLRMYLYLPYAFTIILPLLQSIIGAIRHRESAWLLHGYVTIFSAVIIVVHALSLLIK